jgi:hypothetical protein
LSHEAEREQNKDDDPQHFDFPQNNVAHSVPAALCKIKDLCYKRRRRDEKE